MNCRILLLNLGVPKLNKIVIRDFRNIELQELEFSPNVNCICGGNGEGKTNLLDAVWYLSMTKSAFGATDRYNYRHGCCSFVLSGLYSFEDGQVSRIAISVNDGGEKTVKRDGKAYSRLSGHIGLIPIVMVSPSDTSMISESGEERRKFVNSVLSQFDRTYLENVLQYDRLLRQRNALLREGGEDDGFMDVLEDRMSFLAAPIFERRKKFCDELNPLVQKFYNEISGGKEAVCVIYDSDSGSVSLREVLASRRQRDRILKYTSSGPQRDDFRFCMDGYPLRKCGSQGQQKSFLVALKFAQYEIMREACGCAPLLLLDDLFDKLDIGRVGNLLKMVSGTEFGQIFITDSNKVRIRSLVDELTADRAYFEAEGGAFGRL